MARVVIDRYRSVEHIRINLPHKLINSISFTGLNSRCIFSNYLQNYCILFLMSLVIYNHSNTFFWHYKYSTNNNRWPSHPRDKICIWSDIWIYLGYYTYVTDRFRNGAAILQIRKMCAVVRRQLWNPETEKTQPVVGESSSDSIKWPTV